MIDTDCHPPVDKIQWQILPKEAKELPFTKVVQPNHIYRIIAYLLMGGFLTGIVLYFCLEMTAIQLSENQAQESFYLRLGLALLFTAGIVGYVGWCIWKDLQEMCVRRELTITKESVQVRIDGPRKKFAFKVPLNTYEYLHHRTRVGRNETTWSGFSYLDMVHPDPRKTLCLGVTTWNTQTAEGKKTQVSQAALWFGSTFNFL